MAGVTLETASRVVRRLKDVGLVRKGKRELVLAQPQLLADSLSDSGSLVRDC
jgi:hypothetical protein